MFQKPSPEISLSYDEENSLRHSDEVETVVGPSVHVEGDFASEGNILVKGIVSGNVKTSQRLTVEGGAKIFANVKAGQAIISGEIKGNVKVDGQLELTGTARVAGDITCEVLVIEAGALIHGKVSMKGIQPDSDKGVRRSTRRAGKRMESEEAEMGDSEE